MQVQCPECLIRGKCNDPNCPTQRRANALYKVKNLLSKQDFSSQSPTVFVGSFNYPHVNVGIMAPPEHTENTEIYDAPIHWAQNNYQIPRIMNLRSNLVNSRFTANVKQKNRFLDISKEIAMASKPVDVEVNLKDKPRLQLNFNKIAPPTGPNALLNKVEITSNPKIHKKVEQAVEATDLKAHYSILSLYEHGFDENQLTRLLSTANLGLKPQRKLVPTRWAITAVDDMIAKNMHQTIKTYQKSDYKLYFGSYLGNYYLMLLFPEIWSFELFETYVGKPHNPWSKQGFSYATDYEPYQGRKTYAQETAGGYYAARLAVLEKLTKIRRQASVLTLRFITDEYFCPLGVWVCRSAARKALTSKPLTFNSKSEMFKYTENFVKQHFNFDLNQILNNSQMVEQLKQPKLSHFF